jgi:hypothetical protein
MISLLVKVELKAEFDYPVLVRVSTSDSTTG